jgi:hypothetical protein
MAKKKYKCGGKMKSRYDGGGFLPNILTNTIQGGVTGGLPGAALGLLTGGLQAIGQNKAKKEAEERQQRLLDMQNLQNTMASFNQANTMYEQGGSLNQEVNVTQYNGLPHELGGLPLTDDIEVENNETRGIGNTKDYIFSDSLQPDPKSKETFADISKKIEKKYKGYENDKFANKNKDKELSELMFEQEALKKDMFEQDFTDLVNKHSEQIMKLGGGLSREKNYGSKDKPYPSVNSSDFAGGNRSYPIPTKADAIDALRLAGLHNRPDVKAKVYSKYPSLKALGGPVDPPKGGEKRYLSQEEYDNEVVKRKAAYDKSFNQYLTTQASGADLNDPNIQAKYRSEYEQLFPLDLNDIAVKQIAPSGFDYTDKTWVPSSAAISKYKSLIDAGKTDEANNVVLGHFQKGKGGGQYRKSTHGEAEKLGNVKPIRLGDVGEVIRYAGDKVPDLQGILDNMKYGGNMYPDGGEINPSEKNKKYKTRGIKDYTPEQLDYHRQVLKKLYELNPESGISNYPQYALQAIRNPQLFGQPEIRSNFTINPKSVVWNPDEGNPTVAYISPDISPTNSEYANRPRVGITAQEFKSNPEFYKNVLGGAYGDVAQYVLGQKDVNVDMPVQELNREDVLNMVNAEMAGTTPENVQFAYGGPFDPNVPNLRLNNPGRIQGGAYGVYNEPFALNPADEMNQVQVNPPVDKKVINTQQYQTNPDKYQIQYNPNYNVGESMKFADYQGNPKHWTNDNQFIYTQPNVEQALLDKGLSKDQIRNFFRPGYAEQFFDNLAQNPNATFSQSQFKNDRRFGPEHMLAIEQNKDLIPGNEPIPPIQSYGPPNFEIDQNMDLNKIAFSPQGNPNIQGNPPEDGQGRLKRFRPDLLAAGLSALPNIGMGIGNLNLANNLEFQRTSPEIAEPDYVDPTRAIQEIRDQYAGVKDVARQVSGGSGNLMSNLIGATSSQTKATSGVASQYDNINAGISNQFEQFNVGNRQQANNINTQIANQEEQLRTSLKQQGYENLAQGLAGGIGTYYDSKRYADQMNVAGGENFYYRTLGNFNRTPVRVFRGNGFHYYEDPDTGSIKYLDPNTGQEIKDIDAYKNKKTSNKK